MTELVYVGELSDEVVWDNRSVEYCDSIDAGRPLTVAAAKMMDRYLECPRCHKPRPAVFGGERVVWGNGTLPTVVMSCGHYMTY